jgi:hypothetical protein
MNATHENTKRYRKETKEPGNVQYKRVNESVSLSEKEAQSTRFKSSGSLCNHLDEMANPDSRINAGSCTVMANQQR